MFAIPGEMPRQQSSLRMSLRCVDVCLDKIDHGGSQLLAEPIDGTRCACRKSNPVVLMMQSPRRVPLLALFGPHAMSGLSPECAPKQTSADHSEFMIGSRPS